MSRSQRPTTGGGELGEIPFRLRPLRPRLQHYARHTAHDLELHRRARLAVGKSRRTLKRRKEGKKALLIPNLDQFRALLAQMRWADGKHDGKWSADLVEFLALSGCRLGEVTAMKWGDVNFKLKAFTVSVGDRNDYRLSQIQPRQGCPR